MNRTMHAGAQRHAVLASALAAGRISAGAIVSACELGAPIPDEASGAPELSCGPDA